MYLKKLFIFFSVVLILSTLTFTYFNYKKNLELLVQSKQRENALKSFVIKEKIESILNNIYIKYLENKELHKKLFFEVGEEVVNNKDYSLKEIQNRLNNTYDDFHFDLYLINKDYVIFDTTYEKDMNLDFKKLPSVIPTIQKVYNRELDYRYSSPQISNYQKNFIQYQLYRPQNSEIMVQMGVIADKDNLFYKTLQEIEEKIPNIISYDFYILNNDKKIKKALIESYLNKKIKNLNKNSDEYFKQRDRSEIFEEFYLKIFDQNLPKDSLEIKKNLDNKISEKGYVSIEKTHNLDDSSLILLPVDFHFKNKRKIYHLDYYFIIELDNKENKIEINELKFWTFIYVLFALIVVFLIMITIYKKILQPIFYIKDMMEEKSIIENSILNSSSIELAQVMNSYNELLTSLKKEIKENEFLLSNFKIFTANSIHQIRIPLTVINLYNDMLENGEVKNNIKSSLVIMEHIYDNLSYKVRKDYLEFKKEKINVSNLLKKRIDLFAVVINANDKEVISKIEDDIVLEINNTEIEYIIDNNLSNAIKYGFVNESIYINFEKLNDQVVLTFKNKGNEIQNKEKIFDRYTRETVQKQGQGIGLHMVKEICDKYNIEIKVEHVDGYNRFSYIWRKYC